MESNDLGDRSGLPILHTRRYYGIGNDTTYVLCELQPDPDLPPEPQNLEASVFNGNNVHLIWEEPNYTTGILLAYNVYRNGIIIQSVLEEEYFDLNMINGQYNYFATAVV